MLAGYQALVMLPTQNAPSLESIAEMLHNRFALTRDRLVDSTAAPPQIEATEADSLTISIADWQIHLHPNRDPSVLAEAQEIAALYLEPDDRRKTILPTYDFRIEIACDPDPTMERFNYYVYVIETLETIPGAIVFDPTTTGFIE